MRALSRPLAGRILGITFFSTGAAMVFYSIVGVLAAGVLFGLLRSPLMRAHLRGHGSDPAQWGSQMDHHAERGFGQSWNDDGVGGKRDSQIQSKHTRRR